MLSPLASDVEPESPRRAGPSGPSSGPSSVGCRGLPVGTRRRDAAVKALRRAGYEEVVIDFCRAHPSGREPRRQHAVEAAHFRWDPAPSSARRRGVQPRPSWRPRPRCRGRGRLVRPVEGWPMSIAPPLRRQLHLSNGGGLREGRSASRTLRPGPSSLSCPPEGGQVAALRFLVTSSSFPSRRASRPTVLGFASSRPRSGCSGR